MTRNATAELVAEPLTRRAFPGICEVHIHLVAPVHSTRTPYHPSSGLWSNGDDDDDWLPGRGIQRGIATEHQNNVKFNEEFLRQVMNFPIVYSSL